MTESSTKRPDPTRPGTIGPRIDEAPPPLDAAVRLRRERLSRGQREGRRSIGQDLAMTGVIGWTIVIPTLLGIFAGRFLDRKLESGIFWTLGLLVAGLALGCSLAWRRLWRE